MEQEPRSTNDKQEPRSTNDSYEDLRDNIYEDLEKFGADVNLIKNVNPTGKELEDLKYNLERLVKEQRRQAFKINPLKIIIPSILAIILGGLVIFVAVNVSSGDSVAQSLAKLANIASIFGPSHVQCAFQTTSCDVR